MKQSKHLLLLAALLHCIATNAHDFEADGIYYNIISFTEKTVEVTYQGEQYDSYDEYNGTVIIPETVAYNGNTYRVTKIRANAFRGCDNLTSVTIPKSATEIEDDAFKDCNSLSRVFDCAKLAIHLHSSGNGGSSSSFFTVSGLSSLTTYGEFQFYTFYGVHILANYIGKNTEIVLPDSYNGESYKIGNNAFSGCSSLTTIVIPEGVKAIGDNALWGCSSLTSITIPESVTEIGRSAFKNCNSLTSITIPEGVTEIGNDAFSGCSSLTSITIPESVTKIGRSAFKNCNSLTSITIPEGVTEIGDDTFSGCSSLTSITIPESVTEIGRSAFKNCIFPFDNFINNSACIDGTYWGATIWNRERDGLLLLNDTVVHCRPYVIEAIIPEGVISIGNGAFAGCDSLTSVTIPESVTKIGSSAFRGCSSLTSITIPESVTKIGSSAFSDCNSLTSITIPKEVKEIGNYAFSYCSNLKSIILPESVTNIGIHAFAGCLFFSDNFINNSACTDNTTYWGATIWNKENNGLLLLNDKVVDCFPYVIEAIIPEGVISIGNGAFAGCDSLTSITIPESVTKIGSFAFSGCNGLTSITIPKSVTEIGDYAFRDCNSLTSITIPKGVTEIGEYTFRDCTSLSEIIFEDGNETLTLGHRLFYDCPLEKVYLGRNLSYCSGKPYGYSPFYNSSRHPTFSFGYKVTNIPAYLYYNSNLTSIDIPEGITTIEDWAFAKCSNLVSVTIPKNVTSIGFGAFSNCSNLSSITCDAIKPPVFSEFGNFNKPFSGVSTDIPVYVPSSSIEDYQSATGWETFTNFVGK